MVAYPIRTLSIVSAAFWVLRGSALADDQVFSRDTRSKSALLSQTSKVSCWIMTTRCRGWGAIWSTPITRAMTATRSQTINPVAIPIVGSQSRFRLRAT